MTTRKSSIWDKKIGKDTQRQERASSSFGYLDLPKDMKVFSPEPEGRVKLDFLPYEVTDPKHPDRDPESDIAVPGTLWYKRPFRTHRNIGVEQDTVVCLTSIGKKCPICEYRTKLANEKAEKEVIDALKPSLRNLYIVVPLNSKKFEVEIHVFDISQAMFQKQLNADLKEREENRRFPDLEEGKTLDIRFESTTFGGSKPFPKCNRIDFDERKETYDESILEQVPNLDKILKILSYEELSAKFFEMDSDDDGGKLKSTDRDEKEDKDEKDEKTDRKKNPLASKKVEKEKEPEKEKEKEKEKEPNGPTWEDLQALSGRKLTRFCDDNKLKLDPDKYEEDDDLRKAIAKELDIDMPEEKKHRRTSAEKEQEKETKGTNKEPAADSDEKCPSGHVFGKDTSKFKECDDCPLWDDCDEANLKSKK
jgi:hypothetical protein